MYTQAVILEGLRWGRILVHGVPKKITQDFVYRKYCFKKVRLTLAFNAAE